MSISAVLDGTLRHVLVEGEALATRREMPEACIDAVVTDPPAGIEFMEKGWDDFRRAHNPADAVRR